MPAATSAPLRPEPVKEKKPSAAATGGAPKLTRPDQTAYKSEQDALDKEIGVVREELVSVASLSLPSSALGQSNPRPPAAKSSASKRTFTVPETLSSTAIHIAHAND